MSKFKRRKFLALSGTAVVAGCLEQLTLRRNPDGGKTPNAETANAGDENQTDAAGDSVDEYEPNEQEAKVPTTTRNLPLPAEHEALRDDMEQGTAQNTIPSIDDPKFISANTADEIIDPGDPIFGVVRNEETKAYSQHVMVWHEIVNDTIGGDPVAITYCPLTGTAQGFERGSVEFGVSGMLLNSNLIMYDRTTDSYWPQMLATAIKGAYEGDELVEFNVTWTTWDRWRSTYPDTSVLSEDTGYARDYRRDPYGWYNPPSGYYENDSLMFPQFGSGSTESDHHPKRVFIGSRTVDGALAVAKDTLSEAGLVKTEVGGVLYIVVYDPNLDTGWFYRNPDERSVAFDGETITVDGTKYDPDDLPLKSIVRYDAMWFAWEGYYPETTVIA